ncbi:MAG: MraY family glycosyltransferase [Isosphaeraceae bacterium]|nr:MraY family glycosyltransferase [Isosphaeraceae bacterium]
MLISNSFLLIFAVAFMGCVLATPVVTRIAVWAGAIDRPDSFRRIHKGATPRLGGLGLAFGLGAGVLLVAVGRFLEATPDASEWWSRQWAVFFAALIVLGVGFIDDTRGMSPRVKLLGQASAVLVLYFGGIRIEGIDILGFGIDLGHPSYQLHLAGRAIHVAPIGLFITMFWFLGCMNVWNLIDGMDGLASGVGLLVCGTLTLVALHNNNVGVAILASSLAGSLAGFLLYNWHPACIFLGDSGSLLIGLLIGVIGVQGSMKGPSAISILFPILAMGLPISDTAMAIFRRWVRNLPLSSADRKHVHHLLIGFGLNPRQAALLLYCFTGFFCGVVLLGVALRNEILALILGISGCLAFLLILMSRRDELANLRGDLRARLARGKQERFAAKVTWEAIQRIELCDKVEPIYMILDGTARQLGCDVTRVEVSQGGLLRDQWRSEALPSSDAVSGASAVFRLSSGQDLWLTVSVQQGAEPGLAADIAFRFLQRLSLATVERIARLLTEALDETPAETEAVAANGTSPAGTSPADGNGRLEAAPPRNLARAALSAWRASTGWGARPVASQPSLGKE